LTEFILQFTINPRGLFEKKERERIGRGARWGKRRKVRGFLAKPPFLPLPRSRTEKGGRQRWGGRPAVIAGEPSHRSGQEVGENEEGDEGD
jgi:hypothetical protein